MLIHVVRQVRQYPSRIVLGALVVWWSAIVIVTNVFKDSGDRPYDEAESSKYALRMENEGSSARHKWSAMEKEKSSRRERTLLTIVCNTNQDPDPDKRNIFQRQLNQTKTMLKSLVFFSSSFSFFRVIVITDTKETYNLVLQQLQDWPTRYRSRLHLERADLWLPKHDRILMEGWRPCSWPKLFLHEALPHLDAAVYVDTDILFLGPTEHLWDVLENLKPNQILAMGPDPYYEKYKYRKYAGSVGLSAGLLAVNFTRLRNFSGKYGDFTSTVMHYKESYPNSHDQDTLNTILFDNPEVLYELGGQWMFCPSQCLRGILPCCLETGVNVLHGFDAVFVREVEMVFRVMYEGLLNFDLNSSVSSLLNTLDKEFFIVDRNALSSNCRKVNGIQDIFTKHIRDLVALERLLGNNNKK